MHLVFLTPLRIEHVSEDTWITLADFAANVEDQIVTVPAHYVTDFASVPRLPLAYLLAGNTAHKSALLHDWLYSQGKESREWCDTVFLNAMRVEGVPWWRRRLMYLAVRAAGASRYGYIPESRAE